MTRAELESFVTERVINCWQALMQCDVERGGDGKLIKTAIALTEKRTCITLYSDYPDDERRMWLSFTLPQPLPADEDLERGEIVGDWQKARGGFLLRLHQRLEKHPPELPEHFTAVVEDDQDGAQYRAPLLH